MSSYGFGFDGILGDNPNAFTGLMDINLSNKLNPTPGSSLWNMLKEGMGTSKEPGPLAVGWDFLKGLGSAYMGMQHLNTARDQLKFQKDAWNKNYNVQKNLVNSQLEDRAKARAASSSYAEDPTTYLAKYGVK